MAIIKASCRPIIRFVQPSPDKSTSPLMDSYTTAIRIRTWFGSSTWVRKFDYETCTFRHLYVYYGPGFTL